MWQLLEWLKDYRRSTTIVLGLVVAVTLLLGWHFQRWNIAIPVAIIELLVLFGVIEE